MKKEIREVPCSLVVRKEICNKEPRREIIKWVLGAA
jgi:hypothetical protein